jgi:hypothetical protein
MGGIFHWHISILRPFTRQSNYYWTHGLELLRPAPNVANSPTPSSTRSNLRLLGFDIKWLLRIKVLLTTNYFRG